MIAEGTSESGNTGFDVLLNYSKEVDAGINKASNYFDEIEPIITLLKCILPGERALMKAYQ